MKTRFPAIVEMHNHIKKHSPATAKKLRNLIAALGRPLLPITEYNTTTTTDDIVQTIADLYLHSAEFYDTELERRFREEVYSLHDARIIQRKYMLSASGISSA